MCNGNICYQEMVIKFNCRLYFHYAKDNNNYSHGASCVRVNKFIVAGDSLFEFEETLRNQIIPH